MLVIKIGGGAAIGEGGYTNFAEDLAHISEPVVVVHGGNAEFSELSRQLGMPPRMITSSSGRVTRYTDAATMDVMLMAYCGKVNKRLVATLRAAGVNAVGLSAIDGGIAVGRRKPVLRGTEDGKSKVLREDHAGTLETVDPSLVLLLLAERLHTGAHAARARRRGHPYQRRWRQARPRARYRASGRRAPLLLRHSRSPAGPARRVLVDRRDRRLFPGVGICRRRRDGWWSRSKPRSAPLNAV